MVHVKCNGQITRLPLLVVEGDGPSLLGRNWLKAITLDWQQIYWVCHSALDGVLQKYKLVFSDKLALCNKVEARIHIHPSPKQESIYIPVPCIWILASIFLHRPSSSLNTNFYVCSTSSKAL